MGSELIHLQSKIDSNSVKLTKSDSIVSAFDKNRTNYLATVDNNNCDSIYKIRPK